ncbi:sulfotransferase domain-containing protein [Vibrio cyclitrophicus]|uniref:sulfotransferase domain-containing protein n=1 Tax=Vibrio cyclitrophicus TaxID=47951 RepID=UPI000C832CD3|nr:sulfotransferase domain-containing protein [Vibrio cyclitrophicus]PME67316.1 hypothetical protein BCV31_11075 [Vibrio cyclitrophicus]
MSDKVNCFLIGAQKSGSTALARYMEQIDKVCVSSPKATNYFNHSFYKSFQIKSYSEYKNTFKNKKAKYFCDASDCYHADSESLAKIKKYNENAKVIFIIRELSSMIVSLHEHLVWAGYQKEHDLNRAWSNGERASGKYKEYLDYKGITSIGNQAQVAYDLFGDNLLILSSSELREQPLKVINRICKFLDVEELDKIEKVVVNERVRRKSKIISLINNIIPSTIKTRIKISLNSKGIEIDGIVRKINMSKKTEKEGKIEKKIVIDKNIQLHIDKQNKIISNVMSKYESSTS